MDSSTITLIPEQGAKPIIKFMFNPSELQMDESNQPQDNPGANNLESGQPKVSFATKASSTLTLNEVIFDTYEDGTDVIEKFINPFKEGMTFVAESKRPPVYRVVWGNQLYMRRCFIQNLTYKITKFLPDGTPVRASVNVVLKKAEDETVASQGAGAATPSQSARSGLQGFASLFTGIFG